VLDSDSENSATKSQIYLATVPGSVQTQVGGSVSFSNNAPAPGGQYTGQLQRDQNGTLLQYEWHNANGFQREPPTFFYQFGSRSFTEPVEPFSAPALPDDLVIDRLHDDLCSLQVHISVTDSSDAATAITIQAEAGSGQSLYRSTFSGDHADTNSDPQQAEGFTHPDDGTIAGETLVRADVVYQVSGSVLFANGTVGSFGPVPSPGGDGSCGNAILPVTVVEPRSTIAGTFFFEQDPADVGADAGVHVNAYRIGFFSADGGYASGTATTSNPGNLPVSYSIAVPQGSYWFGEGQYSAMGSQIDLTWSPGGEFGRIDGVNFNPDAGTWSPLVAANDTDPADTGISPDGLIYVPNNDSAQTANLHARMSFVTGHVTFAGCLPKHTVGLAQVAAYPKYGDTYTGQDGNPHAALVGSSAGVAFGPIFAAGNYEIAAFPGPWTENAYFNTLTSDADVTAPDYVSEYLNIFPTDPRTLALVPGRAHAAVNNRGVTLGAVTVAMRVQNQDGSPRPFNQASASIDFPSDPNESFSVSATIGTLAPLRTLQTIRMLVPVSSTVTIIPHGLVGENTDGTGQQTLTDFPPLTGVQVAAPSTANGCTGLCIDSVTGLTYTDDGTPPSLALLMAVPATVTSALLTVSGTFTDAKPILAATLNGVALALTRVSSTKTSFSVPLQLSPGNNSIAIAASDACGETTSQTAIVKYLTAPVLAPIAAQTVPVGAHVTFTATATDADGDVPTLSATGLPAGAAFAGGVFTWTPTQAQVGVATITVSAAASGLTASLPVAITVTAAPLPPVVGPVAEQSTLENQALTFTVTASDPQGLALTCTAAPLPDGATFVNRVFSWTPGTGKSGDYKFTVTCTDTAGVAGSAAVEVSVGAQPPKLNNQSCACATGGPADFAAFFSLLLLAYPKRRRSS
jgi:hypothetical protein